MTISTNLVAMTDSYLWGNFPILELKNFKLDN